MIAKPDVHSVLDRHTMVQVIQEIFGRSPIFCDAIISESYAGLKGKVTVDVSFGRGATAFRVVAPSVEEAYAVLHELATAMVELERGGSASGRNRAEALCDENTPQQVETSWRAIPQQNSTA